MKLHQLRNLVAVADADSIRGAARQLGLAQPTVTRGLRDLEADLGVPLLERHGKGVTLNAYGLLFVVRARSILHDLERGREEIDYLKSAGGGGVNVGLSSAVLLSLAPGVFKEFRKRYPKARLTISEGLFAAIEPLLRSGQIDFYIGPRPQGGLDKNYAADLLFINRRVVACRRGHPLRKCRSLRDLLDADWIFTGASPAAASEYECQFTELGFPVPHAVTQTQTALPIIALLNATDAIAFLPHQWLRNPLFSTSLTEIPVEEPLKGPEIMRVMRRGVPLTPLAEQLGYLFEKEVLADKAR